RGRAAPPPLLPYTTLFRSTSQKWVDRRSRRLTRVHVPVVGCDAVRRDSARAGGCDRSLSVASVANVVGRPKIFAPAEAHRGDSRSEEHTSELQSRGQLVCR